MLFRSYRSNFIWLQRDYQDEDVGCVVLVVLPCHLACRILVSQSEIKPRSWQWNGRILTTRLPGKSSLSSLIPVYTPVLSENPVANGVSTFNLFGSSSISHKTVSKLLELYPLRHGNLLRVEFNSRLVAILPSPPIPGLSVYCV